MASLNGMNLWNASDAAGSRRGRTVPPRAVSDATRSVLASPPKEPQVSSSRHQEDSDDEAPDTRPSDLVDWALRVSRR